MPKKILLVIGLLIGLSLVVAGYTLDGELKAHAIHDDNDVIAVTRGMALDEILSKLESKHILRKAFFLKLYVRLSGLKPVIRAGDYKFASPITPLEVLKTLEAGGIELDKLTVIEGWTRFEIADAMAKIKSLHIDRKQALALMNKTSLISDIDPMVQDLEGYLFPDTYFVQSDTKAEELIAAMVDRFRIVWGKVQNPYNFTPHKAVTMASIVETEAKLEQERPIIASVINNRIARRMPLAMDSTIVYASKKIGKWKGNGIVYQSDLDLKSPYNTRKYSGLPPGPVGSPGQSSINAVLMPASSNYIYYVRDPAYNNGKHNFYSNAQDFEVGVQKLRAWEASQKKAH
ncbi:endolytic transglycosylase MltG [soil metagenome]